MGGSHWTPETGRSLISSFKESETNATELVVSRSRSIRRTTGLKCLSAQKPRQAEAYRTAEAYPRGEFLAEGLFMVARPKRFIALLMLPFLVVLLILVMPAPLMAASPTT